ncbi:helix-turn-helix domain-containing protein [Williamsia phyllosphaerae]|uniref:HTH araC/xylS-type domain-containing protein n=1 Tax=Williamsia phyllosphaerae TaxID=885042 RepID=A0ABQ1UI75_9NOCA|nr:helix-turn-helix domain-containing protein [Williamsia phyllosphaerae]GGF19639.1 hypothetical protein GCM10007298_14630 [Williamsia phyllosphaerae]
MTVVNDTPPRQALDRALAALEWTLVESGRVELDAGRLIEHSDGPAGFVFVTTGLATLWVDDGDGIDIAAGDLVIVPRVHRYRLRAQTRTSAVRVNMVPTVDGRTAADTLPSAMTVRRFSHHEPQVIALIEDMSAGCGPNGSVRLGDSVICSRSGTMVVSVAIRRWFELGCAEAGWLRQVQDPHISRAVDELHRDLGRSWTVDDLARVAAMSRSGFAVRFRDLLGQPPVAYLAAARIDAAKRMLKHGDVTVTEVSHRLGYGSDAGFSRAFQRHEGVSPTRWRAARRASGAHAV